MLTRIRKPLTTFALAATGGLLLLTAAQAQNTRFISSAGDDANLCTREASCRTLQRGITRTPAGGELQILDAGVYGNDVIVNKSITISAVGVSATAGNIMVDAPGATVVLRGLLLSGTGGNTHGILVANAATVHIVDCQIERFRQRGISIDADNVEVFVANTAVRGNGNAGLWLPSSSSGARVVISTSRFENNSTTGVGNNGTGRSQITIENSIISGNGTGGIAAFGNGAVVRVSNSLVAGNDIGFANVAGSTFLSRGNNTVSGNGADTQGAITLLPGT
jgi:hypothetical protein